MTASKLDSIKKNIFPCAFHAVSNSDIIWHKHADSNNSSQAITVDVFGTIKMSRFKDEIINEICKQIGMPSSSNWCIDFEWQEPKKILNEPKQTDVDVYLQAVGISLIIECKFTEQDCGSCTQPHKITKGKNKGISQCNGNYELQLNSVNNIINKCALTGKGVKYWDYIPSIYDTFKNNTNHFPCPFKNGNYQWMRNLCIVEILRRQNINSKFILAYVESDYLSISNKVKESKVFGKQLPNPDLYSFITFQEIIDYGLTSSKDDLVENKKWNDLKKHLTTKLDKAIKK